MKLTKSHSLSFCQVYVLHFSSGVQVDDCEETLEQDMDTCGLESWEQDMDTCGLESWEQDMDTRGLESWEQDMDTCGLESWEQDTLPWIPVV